MFAEHHFNRFLPLLRHRAVAKKANLVADLRAAFAVVVSGNVKKHIAPLRAGLDKAIALVVIPKRNAAVQHGIGRQRRRRFFFGQCLGNVDRLGVNIQQYFLLLFNLSRRFGKRAIRAAWLSCHTGVLLGLRCRIRIGRFARLGSRNIRRRNFRRLFRGRLGSRFRFIGDVGFFQNIHIAQQPAAGLVFHQRAPQGLAGLGYAQLAVEKLPQHKHRHGAVETIAAVLPHIPFMQPNDDAAAYAQIFRFFIPHRFYRQSI